MTLKNEKQSYTECRAELRQQILQLRSIFLKTYDKSMLPSIIIKVKEFILLEKDNGVVALSLLDIYKIDESNFGLLMDYIISGNTGYVNDYRDSI